MSKDVSYAKGKDPKEKLFSSWLFLADSPGPGGQHGVGLGHGAGSRAGFRVFHESQLRACVQDTPFPHHLPLLTLGTQGHCCHPVPLGK